MLGIDYSFVISSHTCRQVLYNFSSCAKSAWILTASAKGETGYADSRRIGGNGRADVSFVSFPVATWHPFSMGYLSNTFIMWHVKLSSLKQHLLKVRLLKALKTSGGRLKTGDALLTYAYVWLSFGTILHTLWKCAQIVVAVYWKCCLQHGAWHFFNKLIRPLFPLSARKADLNPDSNRICPTYTTCNRANS